MLYVDSTLTYVLNLQFYTYMYILKNLIHTVFFNKMKN